MFFRRIPSPQTLVAVSALLAVIVAVNWFQPGGPPAAVAASVSDGSVAELVGPELPPQQAGTVGNPSNLTANASGAGQVALTWATAANATTYWVYSVKSDGSGSNWTDAGAGNSYVVTGLVPATDYWFNVVATSGSGATAVWSQFSGWASARTWASVQPPAPSRYSAISAGRFHTCGIKMDGSIDCFGSDGLEQSSPPEGEFISVSAGGGHACGVLANGTAVCWGSAAVTSPNATLKFVQVDSGDMHACGLTVWPGGEANYKMVCWGVSSGAGRTDDLDASWRHPLESVSAGDNHNCWVHTYIGDNVSYLRCHGDNTTRQLASINGVIQTVSAGGSHTCWLHGNGTVGCQGDNAFGQITVPAATSGDADESAYIFTTVSAGKNHTCAIDGANGNSAQTVGTARCWGSNLYGESTPPRGVVFTAVSAGASHTCGLKSDGTVQCWGDNSYGQAPSTR